MIKSLPITIAEKVSEGNYKSTFRKLVMRLNRERKRNVLISLGFGIIGILSFAQEGTYHTVQDFEAWYRLKFKYELRKDWSIGLDNQYRFIDDGRALDQGLLDLELKKKFNNGLYVALASRYTRSNDTQGNIQGWENWFRWNMDLGYKYKFDQLALSGRLRYQSRNELRIDDESDRAFRFKLQADYNIKKWKWDPYLSSEIFYENGDDGFYKARFTLGTAYDWKKYGEISGFYRVEHELVGLYPKTTYILGLGYKFTLKNKKK